MSKYKQNVLRLDDEAFLDEKASGFVSRMRNDAGINSVGTGYFFKRELTFMYSKTLKANLPMPNAFRFFPINSEPGEGAKEYTQQMMEPTGDAIIITDFADDLPRVNVVMREETRSIKMIGNSFGYSVQDIMAARFTGKPLNSDLGVAAREAIERKHNRMCWFGDKEHNITGVLRHEYIPRYVFTETLDSSSTSADIIAEINSFLNSVRALTKTTTAVDTLILPPDDYAYIVTTPRSETSGSDTTIAEFLLAKNPWLKSIDEAWELDADENAGQKLCLAYRKSELNVKYVAPITFRQEPVERRNLEFVVNNLASTGGFYTPRPLEMVVGELS